jgi:glycosyltransferase involved in cell wall biosynthesis
VRRRVCIIRHRDYELPLRREAEALASAGYEVDVICLREDGRRLVSDEAGVRCYRLPLSRERGGVMRYLFDYLAFFVAAAVVVTFLHLRRRYDAIQVNTMPDVLAFTTVVPRLLGAKTLVFMKEPSPELAELQFGTSRVTPLFVRMEQLTLRYASRALTVTDQLKERYVSRGADASKIDVVLNGPDPRHLGDGPVAETDPKTFTLVCHGTIEDRYGHTTLLEAVRLARMDVDDLRLLITGSGSGVPALESMIETLDLADVVTYLGHVPLSTLGDVLRGADVGVVPMRSNAYSNLVHTNKMFEYMLLSKPVIATRLASVDAYFDDDSIAFVPPDDPKAMARAIVDLYENPERRTALAERAASLYREYGWERQRELYLAAFDRLLGPST